MHTYRDAIRRTAGAYVLYPGTEKYTRKGFHEILPGLGAFAISPSKYNNGISDLKIFLNEIVRHFLNRTSQREKLAYRTYDIHKELPKDLKEVLPDLLNKNRSFDPDQTFVLVGYYKDQEHLDWILKNNLYNLRTGTGSGSFELNAQNISAKYLLLHTEKELITNNIYELKENGVKVFSKDDLIKQGYRDASSESYFIYHISRSVIEDFNNVKWDLRSLSKFESNRKSPYPITITLTELMSAIKR